MSVRSQIQRVQEILENGPVPPAGPTPATPSLVKEQPADSDLGRPGRNEDERLDEALKETLPTSDPVSIRIE